MTRPSARRQSSETDRVIGEMSRVGVVESVDLNAGTVIVRFGEQLSPPIEWLGPSGRLKIWAPPSEGEQVSVVAPEGDPEQAVIIGGLRSSRFAPLFLGAGFGIEIDGELRITYDADARRLIFDLPADIHIVAPSGARLEADVVIDGDVQVNGDLKASGVVTGDTDVVFAGKSAKAHKHLGVTAGTAVSGGPQ
nr:phage baseplate assembly protein V [Brevundimonas diminuta]